MDKNLNEEEMAKKLAEKELASGMKFDDTKSAEPAKSDEPAEEITSLGKASTFFENQGTHSIVGGESGWKGVPIVNLPSEGMFYPEGATLEIKAASVGEIRHFSMIDEQDPLDLDDKLNMVVEKCMRLRFPNGHASYRDLKEEDRFYIIFAIRELTFKNGENKLVINVKCGATCLGDGSYQEKIEMKKENFEYYKIDPKLMNHYDSEACGFVINSEKVGAIRMFVPSLGVTSFIKNYLRERIQRREFYDKSFIKIAPFLFSDWRGLTEDKFTKVQQESLTWNLNKFSAILKIAEKIRFGAKTELKRQCDKCGAEVTAPMAFPGGVKSIFLPTDSLDDIL